VRALFDVNVLIALFDPAHVHHESAHAWWKANQSSGWATCPLTENGFVRVLSQPKYPNAISPSEAVTRLRESIDRGGHEFWTDDVTLRDAALFQFEHILGHRQITDVYLLALAVRNSGRVVTFDRGLPISAVQGATKAHKAVP
jgi:toxin-antitoxin system PIN domain toxin